MKLKFNKNLLLLFIAILVISVLSIFTSYENGSAQTLPTTYSIIIRPAPNVWENGNLQDEGEAGFNGPVSFNIYRSVVSNLINAVPLITDGNTTEPYPIDAGTVSTSLEGGIYNFTGYGTGAFACPGTSGQFHCQACNTDIPLLAGFLVNAPCACGTNVQMCPGTICPLENAGEDLDVSVNHFIFESSEEIPIYYLSNGNATAAPDDIFTAATNFYNKIRPSWHFPDGTVGQITLKGGVEICKPIRINNNLSATVTITIQGITSGNPNGNIVFHMGF